jgi:UPF0755 protein
MTIRTLAEELQTATIRPDLFTVIEGWRKEEIAAALPKDTANLSPSDFLTATARRPADVSFSDELPEPPNLEGFLFPDTYHLDANLTAEALVLKMIENFELKVGPEFREGFRQRGLSLFQAVTLASIIEREAVIADEQPLIASVFLNRLALGMRLESDPTVQYAIGLTEAGWWKPALSIDDLQVDSPYNTYRYAGLPPGPIANPGINAIRSVAFPAESTFLYFRAACDGSGRHNFAVTFEEHQKNACP